MTVAAAAPDTPHSSPSTNHRSSDRVLRFIDTLPQRDRKVFSYEAQMTRLEEEIQRYKKLCWRTRRTT